MLFSTPLETDVSVPFAPQLPVKLDQSVQLSMDSDVSFAVKLKLSMPEGRVEPFPGYVMLTEGAAPSIPLVTLGITMYPPVALRTTSVHWYAVSEESVLAAAVKFTSIEPPFVMFAVPVHCMSVTFPAVPLVTLMHVHVEFVAFMVLLSIANTAAPDDVGTLMFIADISMVSCMLDILKLNSSVSPLPVQLSPAPASSCTVMLSDVEVLGFPVAEIKKVMHRMIAMREMYPPLRPLFLMAADIVTPMQDRDIILLSPRLFNCISINVRPC